MKKRILSILLLCCMVLTMLPAPAFAADEETYALPPDTGGLCEHHPEHDETCGYTPQTEDAAGTPCGHVCEICESGDGGAAPADSTGTSGAAVPMTLLGTVRPAATQYTYTLHYDANGGSGAPPSQSMTSSNLQVSFPISDKIPTRDGYTFKGWADSPYGEPKYLCADGYYWYCNVANGATNSRTIYAIWEAHTHRWGEWTSNGNGTHKRTCATDSSHTETGNCSGGKATFTERAVCETCHTAYGELLQITKTVITTPPTLPAEGYVGNEYMDEALSGGEAKAEGTGVVVSGSFRFKQKGGGRVVRPGENRMEVLFTPDDTEAYTTAECIVTVTGIKRTITRVPEDVLITDKPLGTPFEDLGLPLSPYGVMVETNTGASFSPIPVTWDGSNYNPNIYGEQIITGQLHVEQSHYQDKLEPTSTVKATARITLIDNRVFTPTLEPPTYSKQLYGGDLCFLVFSDKYLSGGTATANGEMVSGKFTLDKDQKIYGHSLMASTLLQAGQLQLKVIFTPDNPKRYTSAECTVDVNVVPRTFVSSDIVHIPSKKIGTTFEELNLSMSFSFSAVSNETPPGELEGYSMDVVTSWDASTYDPNSFEEQTIYGTVDRAELEKYFTIPESADLRAVRKVRLEPDPVETEITQLPVFQWKNGDFTLPDNTIFTWRRLQVKPNNDEVGTLTGGMAKVKGTDTVAPGTFSFKNAPPFYLQTPGEHDVTVVFTPDDPRLHKPTETTIKINAIKNTIRDTDEPDPITNKPLGTPFAQLGLPENVCINAVDDAWRWIDVAWNESSYDAQSSDWQTITGTLVLDEDANSIFQQPEPAVTASIRVKLIAPPTITTQTLPGGAVGTPYNHQLHANGGGLIEWHIISGALPESLNLNENTGVISGTPAAVGTATFTVKAENSVGSATKELSITIAKPQQYGKVSIDDYVYGETPSTPSLTDRTGDGSVTYYYSTTNSNSGGTKWENIQADTLNAGTYYMYAELGETENYGSFTTACVKFQVLRAIPTYTKPTGLTAKYGQTLANVTLPDGWSWMDSSESVGGASTAAKTFKAKFTPRDTDNYNVAENIALEVTVNKADQAALTIQGADGVVYGQTLALTTTGGSGTGAVTYRIDTVNSTGKATIAPDTGVLTPVKVGSVSVVATKAGDNDYNNVTSAPFVLMIKSATPTGEPKYTEITTSGKTLKDAALTTNGSTLNPTDGRLEWVDDKGNVLPDDTRVEANKTYKWRFTPTDTNYTTLTGEIELYHRSSGGGGSYTPSYTVSADKTENGTITVSPKSAYKGDTVTITVKPDKGYEPDTIKVLDQNGDKVKLTEKDGKYTFKMPDSKVEIQATFVKESEISPFGDVSTDAYYYEAVKWAQKKGITGGIGNDLFGPNQPCTRAQIATFLWRSAGSPEPKNMSSFSDVPVDSYYAKAVAWAVENGITSGTGEGKFSPNSTCTRAQAVTFLYRASGSPTVSDSAVFGDVAANAFYADAVAWAVANGVTNGTTSSTFSPDNGCIRAQIVTFLYRAFNK